MQGSEGGNDSYPEAQQRGSRKRHVLLSLGVPQKCGSRQLLVSVKRKDSNYTAVPKALLPLPMAPKTFSEWPEQKGQEMKFGDLFQDKSLEGLVTSIRELELYPEGPGSHWRSSATAKEVRFRKILLAAPRRGSQWGGLDQRWESHCSHPGRKYHGGLIQV